MRAADAQKAVWSLVKGASPGADGLYGEDLMTTDPTVAAELISIMVHGRLPPAYRGLLACCMLAAWYGMVWYGMVEVFIKTRQGWD